MSPVRSRRLRREEASAYLKNEHGIDRAPKTLAKLACIGGGPAFVKVGRFPLYPTDALDAWATAVTSPLVNSTSELRAVQTAA